MVRDIEVLKPDDSGAVAKSLSAADYALDVANNLAAAEQERNKKAEQAISRVDSTLLKQFHGMSINIIGNEVYVFGIGGYDGTNIDNAQSLRVVINNIISKL